MKAAHNHPGRAISFIRWQRILLHKRFSLVIFKDLCSKNLCQMIIKTAIPEATRCAPHIGPFICVVLVKNCSERRRPVKRKLGRNWSFNRETLQSPLSTRWTTNVSGLPEFSWYVTKFEPHKTTKFTMWRQVDSQ